MLDDIRNHDARPTPEEAQWMNVDPLKSAAHALVMVGLSIMVGVAASVAAMPQAAPAAVVASQGVPSR
ncbi:MAG TPA: hypothetical protein VFO24_06520 [Usitatibacter sp.]|nr:hypothetical protein [Usitatibacter sp.]